MKKENAFLLKSLYLDYLKVAGITPSVSANYVTWLSNKILEIIKPVIAKKNYINDYLNLCCYFLLDNDRYSSISLLEYVFDLVESKRNDDTKRDINNCESALRSFYGFIQKITDLSSVTVEYNKKNMDKIRKELIKAKVTSQIDGNISMLDHFKSDDEFIKEAIKESYFFPARCVAERFNEIADCPDDEELPKRDNNNKNVVNNFVSPEDGYKHLCKNDKDGNYSVRQTIKHFSLISVSEGRESTFQNYTISHVWGNAGDPRYFTNLWNIVLIPTWANGPMDKAGKEYIKELDSKHSDLNKKMLDTYKAICVKLYNMKSLDWERIKMDDGKIVSSGKFKNAVKGEYEVNILPDAGNDDGLVMFGKEMVKI